MGLLTYYSKFLPDLATLLAPLYALLHHDTPWSWNKKREEAFQASKKLLTSSGLLVHFDPDLPLLLACDASSYNIGTVLSHQMQDGTEHSIAFVSRSLTDVERKYSQIEREALACVYNVKKFHNYYTFSPRSIRSKRITSLFSRSSMSTREYHPRHLAGYKGGRWLWPCMSMIFPLNPQANMGMQMP